MEQDRNTRITPSASTISAGKILTTLGFAGLGAFIVYKLLSARSEDRPAMTVRGGSIEFGHDATHPPAWDGGGDDWEPLQPNGRNVKHMVAKVSGADNNCTKLEATHFVITYAEGAKTETFRVFIAGKKPRVGPKGLLRRDSTGKKLKHGTAGKGHISSVKPLQGGTECTFSANTAEIRIEWVYD